MTEGQLHMVRRDDVVGARWKHVAMAALPHLWPLLGITFLHWNLFDAALAYWGVLAGLLGYSLVRMWRLPTKAGKVGAVFFAMHGGAFLFACLMLVVEYVGGFADIVYHPGKDGRMMYSAYNIHMPWLAILEISGLALVGVVAQEWYRGQAARAAGKELRSVALLGRYYLRMVLLFGVLMVVNVADSQRGAWLFLAIAGGMDILAASFGSVWRFTIEGPPSRDPATRTG